MPGRQDDPTPRGGPAPGRGAAARRVVFLGGASFCLGLLLGLGVLAFMRPGGVAPPGRGGAPEWGGVGGGPEQAPGQPPATGPRDRHLGLLLGGDVLLDLEPAAVLATEGPEGLLPGWLELRRRDGVDLGLANLECPLSERGRPVPGKAFTFRADPKIALPALAAGGFDLLSLANNHVLDYGPEALADTLAGLAEYGLAPAGAGADLEAAWAPAIVQRNGVRIAFVAVCQAGLLNAEQRALWLTGEGRPGVALAFDERAVAEAVAAARAEADLVVVSLHAGAEYGAVTGTQRALARAAIDAGAGLVFGHHPHVPQAVEVYRDRPILYSLGNLVFHPYRAAASHSIAALVEIGPGPGGEIVPLEVTIFPLRNEGAHTVDPRIRDPEGAQRFLEGLARQSAALGTRFEVRTGCLSLRLED